MRRILLGSCLLFVWACGISASAADFVNTLVVPGDATDLSGLGGLFDDRLGGFLSDLYFDRQHNVYYGVTDRGPGGGLLSYTPRIQQFGLTHNSQTGALGGLQLQRTMLFMNADGSAPFDSLLPGSVNGNPAALGLSFDPEAIVVGANGHFYVGDEYGPSLYEFAPFDTGAAIEARFVAAFNAPSRLTPRDSLGQVNYVAERQSSPALISGRQDNRGFEGLAVSPDGSTLWAALQDPLAEEGSGNQGRRGRNVRIVRFDTETRQATGEFIYQLEDIATVNARIPGSVDDFTANQQGRQIGVSAIVALNDREFLVLERDTRGLNPEVLAIPDPLALAVGVKRVYLIDVEGATDVSTLSLAGTNTLPVGVNPVGKALLLDIQAALTTAGESLPERMEGLAIGPRLDDGDYSLLIGTDNDYSLAVVNSELVNVFTNGETGPLGEPADGREFFPTRVYAFQANLPSYVPPVPEPSGVCLALVGGATLVSLLRRRRHFGLAQ